MVEPVDEDGLQVRRKLCQERQATSVGAAGAHRGQLTRIKARRRSRRQELARRAGLPELGPQQVPGQVVAEQRERERDPDRGADLAEERQVARGRSQLLEGHRVLHDDREHGERGPDAEAGDEHPSPQGQVRRVRAQLGHEGEADDQQRHSDDDHRLVAARAADDLPRHDRAEDQPEQERQELVARLCRTRVLDLEVERQEDDRRAEAEGREEDGHHRRREGAVAEQVERDDRLGGPALDDHEDDEEHQADEDPAPDRRVAPVAALGEGEAEEDRDEGEDERHDAQIIDAHLPAGPTHVGQEAPDDGQGDEADRDVDEEDPVPGELVGQKAAQPRSQQERDAEDEAEESLVLAALGRGEQVTDHRQRDREERTGAKALDAAEEDELPHLLAQAGQRRPDQEQRDAEDQEWLATVQVGQLAVDRHRDRAGQQVDRDGPRVVVGALEIRHDPRQHRTDDRLVQSTQEQPEQYCAEDLELRALGQAEGGILRLADRPRAPLLDRNAFHE